MADEEDDDADGGAVGDLPVEFDAYATPTGIAGWLSYIGKLLYNVAQLPRITAALAELGAVVLLFLLFNLDSFRAYVDKVPAMVNKSLGLLQKLINLGPAIMSWSLPPWAISHLQFLNSVLPLTEVFQVISALVGLYTLCLIIRIVFKMTVFFR